MEVANATRLLDKLACGGAEEPRRSSAAEHSSVQSSSAAEHCTELTEQQCRGVVEERCGEGSAGEFIERRAELAAQSRELIKAAGPGCQPGAIAQQAANTLGVLQAIASGGHQEQLAVKPAVRVIHDILVLACALDISTEDFEELGLQGLPNSLRTRLEGVLREASGGWANSDTVISDLMSRLGTAKYHLFNDKWHFSRRTRKPDTRVPRRSESQP